MKNKFKDFKQRVNWKTVLITVIAVALVAALGVTAVSLFNKKDKDEDGFYTVDLDFHVGGLNADGTYKETDGSLYTREAIEADTVKVALDFESNVKYALYFYDEFDEFVSGGVELGKGSETVVPEGATHFRLVITPIWGEDVDAEDQKITIFNKNSYIKQLTVSITDREATETNPDAE